MPSQMAAMLRPGPSWRSPHRRWNNTEGSDPAQKNVAEMWSNMSCRRCNKSVPGTCFPMSVLTSLLASKRPKNGYFEVSGEAEMGNIAQRMRGKAPKPARFSTIGRSRWREWHAETTAPLKRHFSPSSLLPGFLHDKLRSLRHRS